MGGPSLVARSIQALEDLRSALIRFGQDASAHLTANEGEIARAQDYLAQRERNWQGEVRIAEYELQRAIEALRNCQAYAARASQSGQGGVSCDREAAAVQAAQARLEKAQRSLEEVKRITIQLHEEIGAYERVVRGLRSAATSDAPRAASSLARHISALRDAAQTGPSGIGGAGGAALGALGGLAAGIMGATLGAAIGNAPSHPITSVDDLQARVDALRAQDAERTAEFLAAREAADPDAAGAIPQTMPAPEEPPGGVIPPGPTPEEAPATEADHEVEGPPGDPHRRL